MYAYAVIYMYKYKRWSWNAEKIKRSDEASHKLRAIYIYISFVNKRVIKDKLKVKNQISKYTISDNG